MRTKLTGMRLGQLPQGEYVLQPQTAQTASALQQLSLPSFYDAQFWMLQAAQNGNIAAQRVLAATDPRWEKYRAGQGDVQFQAWLGARLCLEGHTEQSKDLLQKARVQDSGIAKELLQQL